ncbi:lipase [Kitasatospora herbaricolor]|uniref:alpha/beta hydrolase family protein n=1 Tax=Kitasatospora herbaricolor TaxID=68217 RepID=UPI00174BF300|nr:esterase [Kitasatospora herbaricolor]MDQ0306479.1 dienelactone hydrolase [Kitasatospora herbaricolor]GGV46135.1 lipase [Kitasatospora herbaricolor]
MHASSPIAAPAVAAPPSAAHPRAGAGRRRLAAALALAATATLLGVLAGPAAAAAPAGASGPPATAALPVPTGPFAVGTTSLRLADPGRPDPWHPDRTRELMISLWYPATGTPSPRAPQMAPLAAAHFGTPRGAGTFNYGLPPGRTNWSATRTHARQDAPALRAGGPRPVLLYSAGLGDPRTWNTGLVEDLASRGYVVVTVDHTYEASEVEFPGGRLAESVFPDLAGLQDPAAIDAVLRKAVQARVDDVRLVLDRLTALHAGGDRPVGSADGAVPGGLAGVLDLGRVGMVGHSAGGFTAAQAIHDDPRIKAGVNLDGTMEFPLPDSTGSPFGTAVQDGLDVPFLLMGTDNPDSGSHQQQPSWQAFWQHTRGWHADVTLTGSRHGSYTDAESLLPQLARQDAAPAATVADDIGTVRPERAVAATRAYVASFFDRWLRGRDDHLLDGPSARFPEMRHEP